MRGQENIQEFFYKCKYALEEAIGQWGIILIIFLATFCAFGLGRLSAEEEVSPPVSIEQAPALAQPQGLYPGGEYVASDTGTVYYFPWCSAAESIPAGKQVWFKSESAAQAAGYKPAKNCKGLANGSQ